MPNDGRKPPLICIFLVLIDPFGRALERITL